MTGPSRDRSTVSGPPDLPLSVWLRTTTAPSHRAAEAALLPGGQLSAVGDVVRVVRAHHRVLTASAAWLDTVTAVDAVRPLAAWAAAARRDLDAWGVDDRRPPAPVRSAPVRSSPGGSSPGGSSPGGPPDRAGRDAAVGARYVVEGAQLGLRVLRDRAQHLLVAAGLSRSELFDGAGDPGQRWHLVRRWLDTLDDVAPHGIVRDDVLAGAVAAFASFTSPTTSTSRGAALTV